MSKKRNCLCCGEQYEYCNRCGEYSKYPTWMVEFDKEVCHELFNAISGYNMGIFDKDKVKSIVDKYNINDFSQFKKNIADKLNELFPKSEPTTNIDENESKQSYKKNSKKKNRNMDIEFNENI